MALTSSITADPAVRVRGLRKLYGDTPAVDGIDLDIVPGEVFALLGPNGAGKTTTVEILEGYRRRNAGEVSVLGVDPARPTPPWRAEIGIVLQSTSGNDELVRNFADYYPQPRDPVLRVLLVDDRPVVRAGVAGMLSLEQDIEIVGEAADEPEAVAQARALRPDVVLMDLRMPGVDGVQATADITDDRPDVRVLVLTTYDTDRDIVRAVEAGATGYLLKDAPRTDLAEAVRAAGRGETVLAPPVAATLVRHLREPPVESLTERERDVLALVAEGLTNADIGRRLFIGEATVKTHLLRVFASWGWTTGPALCTSPTSGACWTAPAKGSGSRRIGASGAAAGPSRWHPSNDQHPVESGYRQQSGQRRACAVQDESAPLTQCPTMGGDDHREAGGVQRVEVGDVHDHVAGGGVEGRVQDAANVGHTATVQEAGQPKPPRGPFHLRHVLPHPATSAAQRRVGAMTLERQV